MDESSPLTGVPAPGPSVFARAVARPGPEDVVWHGHRGGGA